jgi:hypothetical protein
MSNSFNFFVEKKIDFDFLIESQLLRTNLEDYLTHQGLSTENTLTLEYVVALKAPKPISAFNTDDWVSSVVIHNNQQIFSACYNGGITIWNPQGESLGYGQVGPSPLKSICLAGTNPDNDRLRLLVGQLNHTMSIIEVQFCSNGNPDHHPCSAVSFLLSLLICFIVLHSANALGERRK